MYRTVYLGLQDVALPITDFDYYRNKFQLSPAKGIVTNKHAGFLLAVLNYYLLLNPYLSQSAVTEEFIYSLLLVSAFWKPSSSASLTTNSPRLLKG